MGDGNGLGVSQILTGPRVCNSRRLQSVERRPTYGRFVAEVLQREHLLGMRPCDRHEALVQYKRVNPALRPLLVDEIEELALRDRIGGELDAIGKIEALGLVLADPGDEDRGATELPDERLDLRLEGDDLGVHEAAGPARFDRGLHVAADRKRLDRQDRHRDDEERADRCWERPKDSIGDPERASTDERDDRPDREMASGREEGLGDDDGHDESDRRSDRLWPTRERLDERRRRARERERGSDRENPRCEAVGGRDEPRLVPGPSRNDDEREDGSVDGGEARVAHTPRY